MNSVLQSLPVVVLMPHSRCNCRCVMCDIWKDTKSSSLSLFDLTRLLDDFKRLSVQWVVLSGGEPLMHPHLFEFCSKVRECGIRITLLSTGLLLERYAAQIIDVIDDVIVSLDGPPAVHDRIRRVSGAFTALTRGVRKIQSLRPTFPIAARTTVQRENFCVLNHTAGIAKALGFRSISFLATDISSTAFNRPFGWSGERQSDVALTAADVCRLESEIETLASEWAGSGFLAENAEKLRRIALHFRAHLGLEQPIAPSCNAPWVSAVIEADGGIRPCFFHRQVGRLDNASLLKVLNGPEAVQFRAQLDVSSNPICRRCVCSLNWKPAN